MRQFWGEFSWSAPMNSGKTLFAQLMDFLPWSTFARIVDRHDGDLRVRTLACTEQFRAMAFAQLTYRESLRDIEVCLSAQPSKLYQAFASRFTVLPCATPTKLATGASMRSSRNA